MKTNIVLMVIAVIAGAVMAGTESRSELPWSQVGDTTGARIDSISAPSGFARSVAAAGSFGEWLRTLPLRDSAAQVRLYDGSLKANQSPRYRVLDIDVGERDLQQCADAVMRLRAEYLYAQGRYDEISFNFTSGQAAEYSAWRDGMRPEVSGNRVSWVKKAAPDSSYAAFRDYLTSVFTYAGSHSLQKQLSAVSPVDSVGIGDVFIQGGFPGHAVIVVDMAVCAETGERAVLLAQSYMPAQNIHILRNSRDAGGSPWYVIGGSADIATPEWLFEWSDLHRFE